MHTRNVLLLVTILLALTSQSQNVGIGTTNPKAQLSVGGNSQFRVDQNGNITRINDVPYVYPPIQGLAGQVLVNDGSGGLTWTTPSSTSVFGDGSAGAMTVNSPLDLSTSGGVNSLGDTRLSLHFTNITINNTLIVPSGTVLKATGTVTINSTGNIIVVPNANSSLPSKGISAAAADAVLGGKGLFTLQAAQLVKAPISAGGSGKIDANTLINNGSGSYGGGGGGGGLTIYAKGGINIVAGGAINANGENGLNSLTAAVGTGGGGGGIIVLASQGTITCNGTLRANGGNGANGTTTTTLGRNGGGGGGGGIVTLISSSAPVTGATSIQVNGGAGGNTANPSGTGTITSGGGGGGASGGNGGNSPGATALPAPTATAGSAGHIIKIIVPNVEQFLLGR